MLRARKYEVLFIDGLVTQMLRQSDAQVFKKYSQMKLQLKREALEKPTTTADV